MVSHHHRRNICPVECLVERRAQVVDLSSLGLISVFHGETSPDSIRFAFLLHSSYGELTNNIALSSN